MFAGLVDYDGQGHVVPDLADRWDVDDGGRTYRFVLRTGVTMHDGVGAHGRRREALGRARPAPVDARPERELLHEPRRLRGLRRGQGRAPRRRRPSRAATSSRSTSTQPDATFLISARTAHAAPDLHERGRPLLGHLAALRRGPFKLEPGRLAARARACASCATRATSAPGCRTSTPSSGPTTCWRSRSACASSAASSTSCASRHRPTTARFAADPRWKGLGVRRVRQPHLRRGDEHAHAAVRQRRDPARRGGGHRPRRTTRCSQPTRMSPLYQALPRASPATIRRSPGSATTTPPRSST